MMEGWKTWTATAVGFATGLGMVTVGVVCKPVNLNWIFEGLLTCAASLGLIGIGHKQDKIKKAIIEKSK